MEWFRGAGLEFVRGIPAVTLDADPIDAGSLFEPERPGSAFDHFLVQAVHVVTGNREGGLFLMIGRKPEAGE